MYQAGHPTYNWNGLEYLNSSTSTTDSATETSVPVSGEWYHIIRMNHSNADGYFSEIATPLNNDYGMYYRMVSVGIHHAWKRLIDYPYLVSEGYTNHNSRISWLESAHDSNGFSNYSNRLLVPRVNSSDNGPDYQLEKNAARIHEYGSSCSNLPTTDWYYVLGSMGADTNYGVQLALGMTTRALYYRNFAAESFSSWKQIPFASVSGTTLTIEL